MNIRTIVGGPLRVNTYLLEDTELGELTVIDPGQHNDALYTYMEQTPLKLKYILVTHGHFDHMVECEKLRRLYGGKIAIHELDEQALWDSGYSLFSQFSRGEVPPCHADILLKDGDVVHFGGENLAVLHTPGHTRGGVCFVSETLLLSGDTVIRGSVGRMDFPTGSRADMEASIEKLKAIPGDRRMLPGHMEETTLERERRENPFFQPGGFEQPVPMFRPKRR